MINTYKYPLIYNLSKEDIISKISDLAKVYTPEWRFNKEEPDIGSVIALIYADLLKDSMDTVNQSIFKHHIAFLNCLETDLRSASPAQSFVTFEIVPASDKGVFIPKGTKLITRSADGDDVVFTTLNSVYASHTAPADITFVSKAQGKIISVYTGKQAPQDMSIKAFDFTGENVQQHAFFISHPYILEAADSGSLKIYFKGLEKDGIAQLTDKNKVKWCLLYEDGFKPVEAAEEKDCIVLTLEDIPAQPAVFYEKCSYWLGLFAQDYASLPDISVQEVTLSMNKQGLVPDVVYAQDVEQNNEDFCPFGNPMQLYSECYIRCDEAFAKQSADIELSFDLDYLTRKNIMFEPEKEVDFKYIMKKPPKKSEPQLPAVKADEAVWEYWNGRGWVKLFADAQFNHLFDTKQTGKVKISFICPKDFESITVNAYEAKWIRIRMIRAENIYTMPTIEYIPKISHLLISYDYSQKPQSPQQMLSSNNMCLKDVTYALQNGEEITLFEPLPFEHPSLFIGFDELPEQSPLSLFFNIENPSIMKTPALSFEYSAVKNDKFTFKGLKVSDGTKGFQNSGCFTLVLPQDFKKQMLFAKERYWIKITNYTNEYDCQKCALPQIKGIYTNTVRVVNKSEAEESFFITDTQGTLKYKLNADKIIETEVYINEKPDSPQKIEYLLSQPMYDVKLEKDEKGNIEALWVKWQQCIRQADLENEERSYFWNQMTQEIIFPNNIFTRIPVNNNIQAVKVKYQVCDGTKANVDKGEINTLQQPITYINRVFNPVEAFGSSDFETIEAAVKRTSKLLSHREKAVTIKDYEEMISSAFASVKKVKCLPQLNARGEAEQDALTVAVLTEDYNKGNHTFLAYKEKITQYLIERSDINLLGCRLYLREPLFIKLAARIWIIVDDMERAYEYQQTIKEAVNAFFNPINGYFDKEGWEIGVLPKTNQLDAYLKALRLNCIFEKIILTAQVPTEAGFIEKALEDLEVMPMAMPQSGNHHIIVDLQERR